MDATPSSKKVVTMYNTALHHNTENNSPIFPPWENQISYFERVRI